MCLCAAMTFSASGMVILLHWEIWQFMETFFGWRHWGATGLIGWGCRVWYVCSCLTLCDPVDCSPPGSSVHGISRQEYLRGLPFPPPGDLPNPGTEPVSPSLAGGFFASEPRGSPGWGREAAKHPAVPGPAMQPGMPQPQTPTGLKLGNAPVEVSFIKPGSDNCVIHLLYFPMFPLKAVIQMQPWTQALPFLALIILRKSRVDGWGVGPQSLGLEQGFQWET